MRATPFLALALLAAAPLAAQEPARGAQPAERVHVVRPGDTLWDLARLYLNDPFLWPEIHRANTDVVANPSLIYPRERLRIPGAGAAAMRGIAPMPADAAAVEGLPTEPERSIFFASQATREEGPEHTLRAVRAEDVPVLNPGDFYSAGLLVQPAQLRPVARVRGKEEASVLSMRMPTQIQLRDRIYLPLEAGQTVAVGQRLQLMRAGRELRPHGRIFVSTGIVTVESIERSLIVAEVSQMFDRIEVGDLALALADFPLRSGSRAAPAAGAQGLVVATEGDRPLVKVQELVFVNVGRQAGVNVGDEFEVYIPPRQERDFVRPEVVVGSLQVVRVADGTATARVTALREPALEPGSRIRTVRRMP